MKKTVETKKILWLSRHNLTTEQRKELEKTFGEIAITQVNATFPNVHVPTEGEVDGVKTTIKPLKELVVEFDVACVVLPINMLQQLLPFTKKANIPLLQAKNKRVETDRLNEKGEKIYEFVHEGWFEIEEIKIIMNPLLAKKEEKELKMKMKNCNWQTVVNITKFFTQGLNLCKNIKADHAYICEESAGERDYRGEITNIVSNGEFEWIELCKEKTEFIKLTSAKSGCSIAFYKLPNKNNKWEMIFFPSKTNPDYKGLYWEIFSNPEKTN